MEQRLKQAGLKATRQRVALLRVLEEQQGRAATAEELFERVQGQLEVDRSTVYRSLASMEAHGLVERMDRRDGSACYCLAGQEHSHLLMCVCCRKTVPVPGCPLRSMVQGIGAATGFVVLGHTLELTGLCPDCAANAQK